MTPIAQAKAHLRTITGLLDRELEARYGADLGPVVEDTPGRFARVMEAGRHDDFWTEIQQWLMLVGRSGLLTDDEPPEAQTLRCPGCGVDHPRQTNEYVTECCNPECGGKWGTNCYHCHHPDMAGPLGMSRPKVQVAPRWRAPPDLHAAGGNIIVRPIGHALANPADPQREPLLFGEIVSVGPKVMDFRVGVHVAYGRFSGADLMADRVVLEEREIMATLDDPRERL